MKTTIPRKLNRTCVNFTNQEYTSIQKIKHHTGLSFPKILKNNLFQKKLEFTPFPHEESIKLYEQLRRIGTNLNQIAKKVNAGILEGFQPEIEHVAHELKTLRRFIVGRDGVS